MTVDIGDLLFGFFFLVGLVVYLGLCAYAISYGSRKGRGEHGAIQEKAGSR